MGKKRILPYMKTKQKKSHFDNTYVSCALGWLKEKRQTAYPDYRNWARFKMFRAKKEKKFLFFHLQDHYGGFSWNCWISFFEESWKKMRIYYSRFFGKRDSTISQKKLQNGLANGFFFLNHPAVHHMANDIYKKKFSASKRSALSHFHSTYSIVPMNSKSLAWKIKTKK